MDVFCSVILVLPYASLPLLASDRYRRLLNALSTMHRIEHGLRQFCHLGLLDGGHVIIPAQVDSPESAGFHVKVWSKVYLMYAATGTCHPRRSD
jgi:DNA-binding IclR family transcriptional regulator